MWQPHYTFDRSRIIVTFGAEGRVDFRPLLRELGTTLRCRVELRQIGDRDVAKLAGGIGRCGRVLCCSAWMTKFDAIGIRMAKEQAHAHQRRRFGRGLWTATVLLAIQIRAIPPS
ncbi:MAG TPA: hypothetical protein DCM17_11685, partial [Dehalococcoidia bacterium]|nr:hypothetical protein [Dehalococcoidia bacterium]